MRSDGQLKNDGPNPEQERVLRHSDSLCLSAGISENPLDGVSADELVVKAKNRVKIALKDKKLYEAFA